MPMEDIPVPCASCKVSMTVRAHIPPRIVNLRSISMVLVEHDQQIVCPHCQAVLIPALAAVTGLGLVTMVVPPEQQDKIIVPPTNSNLHM